MALMSQTAKERGGVSWWDRESCWRERTCYFRIDDDSLEALEMVPSDHAKAYQAYAYRHGCQGSDRMLAFGSTMVLDEGYR